MSNMDKWCMKWNEFDTNIREYFRIIREDPRLFDVTLVTDDGQHIQAHKIILSAGSHFFSDIFLKSNQTNMLIYLKGINSVQLEHLLDFIYNGEASVGEEVLKEFLEIGKELQLKGFETNMAGVGVSVEEKPVGNKNEKEDKVMPENSHYITEENIICDSLEASSENYVADDNTRQTNIESIPMNANSELDLQIKQMIEKFEGVWKCRVCRKITNNRGHMRDHAETHIEGMVHACHICNKNLANRPCLRKHMRNIHSELLSCGFCGKAGMNKKSYYVHTQSRQHKVLSGTLS